MSEELEDRIVDEEEPKKKTRKKKKTDDELAEDLYSEFSSFIKNETGLAEDESRLAEDRGILDNLKRRVIELQEAASRLWAELSAAQEKTTFLTGAEAACPLCPG